MVRVTRSRKKNCDVDGCCSHYGQLKRGPHLRSEGVPATGPVEVVVFRALNPDGSREAWMRTYTNACWSDRQPLPAGRPRQMYAGAVRRARQFVRSGVLA